MSKKNKLGIRRILINSILILIIIIPIPFFIVNKVFALVVLYLIFLPAIIIPLAKLETLIMRMDKNQGVNEFRKSSIAKNTVSKPPKKVSQTTAKLLELIELNRLFERNNKLINPFKAEEINIKIQQPPKAQNPPPPPKVINREPAPQDLQMKLIKLLHFDRAAAERLVESARAKYPDRNEKWIWEKVILDLERDRR
jgi:hypothetical protein